jgi:putative NIF3 family GTP cyclohydrolase 1 type 2
MASVEIIQNIDLDGIQRDILDSAADGVSAAVQDGVSWIKNDLLLGQEQLGHEDFPHVKEATKKQKARRGEMHVLISTGAYKDSWIGESTGLEGTILGGGDLGYAAKLHEQWHIDKLFDKVHRKTTLKIIKDTIKRSL